MFLNGWRCISNSLYSDVAEKDRLIRDLENTLEQLNIINGKVMCTCEDMLKIVSKDNTAPEGHSNEEGLIEIMLRRMENKVPHLRSTQRSVASIKAQLSIYKTELAFSRPSLWDRFNWIFYLLIYLLLWGIFNRYTIDIKE